MKGNKEYLDALYQRHSREVWAIAYARWMNADTGDFEKWALTCTQRMETPVIYFHAPQPMEVSVEVRMPPDQGRFKHR